MIKINFICFFYFLVGLLECLKYTLPLVFSQVGLWGAPSAKQAPGGGSEGSGSRGGGGWDVGSGTRGRCSPFCVR